MILQNLQTIPGIDEMSAIILFVEIGDDMIAFGSPAKLSSGRASVRVRINQSSSVNRLKHAKAILICDVFCVKPLIRPVELDVVFRINSRA